MSDKFGCWSDGPFVEAWDVYFARGHQTAVYCREPATEAEVIAHATTLYSEAYGPVGGASRRDTVPAYCVPKS